MKQVIVLAIALISLVSCQKENLILEESLLTNARCDNAGRTTVKAVKNIPATIVNIGTASQPYWMVEADGTRFYVCNLAENAKVDGLEVMISGDVKSTFPYERLAGTPFDAIEMAKK